MKKLHAFKKREDGLEDCLVCDCAEGELPHDCPGGKQSALTRSAIYVGLIDFFEGKWVPGCYQVAVARAMDGQAVAVGRNADTREILIRFRHRQLLIDGMAAQPEIGVLDLMRLDRGGLTNIANWHFSKCSEEAKAFLLNHEHPHFRSCAALAG